MDWKVCLFFQNWKSMIKPALDWWSSSSEIFCSHLLLLLLLQCWLWLAGLLTKLPVLTKKYPC